MLGAVLHVQSAVPIIAVLAVSVTFKALALVNGHQPHAAQPISDPR
jgi:hypothetical protein